MYCAILTLLNDLKSNIIDDQERIQAAKRGSTESSLEPCFTCISKLSLKEVTAQILETALKFDSYALSFI